MSFRFYDESRLRIDDFDAIDEITIMIDIYTLYEISLSRIQMFFVTLVLKYIRKFLESKSNEENRDNNRREREIDDKSEIQRWRLILNRLSHYLSDQNHELLIQNDEDEKWRYEENEERRRDVFRITNSILKLSKLSKSFDWIIDNLLSKLFCTQLDLRNIFRVLHWSRDLYIKYTIWNEKIKTQHMKVLLEL